jgi:hypothetical protein
VDPAKSGVVDPHAAGLDSFESLYCFLLPADKSLPSKEKSLRSLQYQSRNISMQAIQSFENLVALANDQERLKDARKMVWRDRGEPAVELSTIRQCLMHAVRGGLSKCLFVDYASTGRMLRHSTLSFQLYLPTLNHCIRGGNIGFCDSLWI